MSGGNDVKVGNEKREFPERGKKIGRGSTRVLDRETDAWGRAEEVHKLCGSF